jgi:hypothetical protein
LNTRCEQLELLKTIILEELKFKKKDDDFKAFGKYQAEYENKHLRIENLMVKLEKNKEQVRASFD